MIADSSPRLSDRSPARKRSAAPARMASCTEGISTPERVTVSRWSVRSSTATSPVSTDTSRDAPSFRCPLQRRDVLTKSRKRGDGDAARAEGRSPGEVCLRSRDRRECVLGDDEGAVGGEVDRPLAAGLEPVAPPERIARIVDAVRAREPDVDLPGRVADGRERDLVAGRQAERLRGRCRERRLDDACSSGGRPVPGDQSCVLLETVVEAEHGERIRRTAASLGDRVGV